MRKRSEAVAQKHPHEEGKPTGRFCRVCGEPQIHVDGGVTCKNGHGGADDVGEVGAAPIREAWAKSQTPAKPKEESVRDVSEKLRDELAGDAKPFRFGSAQRRSGEKPLRRDLEDIVETVFVQDMRELWKKLREGLQVGEQRSDHATLLRALDQAELNAQDAHRLFVTAKIEMERWEAENEIIFSAMWNEATRSLQADKESGSRSKQITDADVRAKCATLFPDEWGAQEKKRRAVKLTVDNLGNLAECWMSRCRTLQAMLGKLRG